MPNDKAVTNAPEARRQAPDAVIDKLYSAVQAYVKASGGNIVVIGGVECQEWPSDQPYTFRIAVRCTGKPPAYLNQLPKITRGEKGKRNAKR